MPLFLLRYFFFPRTSGTWHVSAELLTIYANCFNLVFFSKWNIVCKLWQNLLLSYKICCSVTKKVSVYIYLLIFFATKEHCTKKQRTSLSVIKYQYDTSSYLFLFWKTNNPDFTKQKVEMFLFKWLTTLLYLFNTHDGQV